MPGQKSFQRTDRVAAQLRREIGTLVHEAVRDNGLPSVSVSDVEVTRDMSHAKVYVTALQAERAAEAVAGLKDLAREFRYRLGRMLKLRSVPELHFHYDESVDRGEQIENLLRASGITDTVEAERAAQAVADGDAGADGSVDPANGDSKPPPRD